ncbi:alpha/beta hydrolase [Pseudomonas mosselii]|uniref:alpha/beta hydrolase n=1 Tax=Pseudomonas mosselii TaxID=78327 RepID=UPI00244C7ED9|nr:alpha/beta hydrolase [Pseudomonas mosselii]MDH0630917.1 alpha/beta hydrolase [Pseudomonas mosselii]MDH0677193.1 alpha/beta hydrolase [Pseudomonas mosselii]MDH0928361.1 alpha/beta hydrolase [Pseudomonas mosselii]MDH1135862.1 alpha/beta hydrolase [Pseudomonas mosselii]MDH1141551.1 alpha/beta hydrolase [Pseudomonas mosselii]
MACRIFKVGAMAVWAIGLIGCQTATWEHEPRKSYPPLGAVLSQTILAAGNDKDGAMYVAGAVAGFTKSFQPAKYKVVRVRYATDRRALANTSDEIYGGEPGAMSYGSCYVSIPSIHKIGELESPSWLKWEFTEDPEKHVVMLYSQRESTNTFFEGVTSEIERGTERSALIFVHGYNVSFEEAARRTAQMADDLQFSGVSAFFSWPSRAKYKAYTVDERNIEWAELDIKNFLRDFMEKTSATHIYLVAHSMGTRGLTRALAALSSERPELAQKVRGIILAAPDIDAEVFKRDIAPKLVSSGRSFTLYASSNDKALMASKMIHGYSRAGESGKGIVVLDGMDTIDASSVDTDLVGHSYFGDARTIISDMHYLVRGTTPPNKRSGLESVGIPPDRYWYIKP